jgi:alpha-L-rhamnosidase
MKRIKFLNANLLLLLLFLSFKVSAAVLVTDIRCENLVNPLGIDKLQPSFNWKINSDQRGTVQKAYQIMVASSPEKLKEGKPDYWDSQKIESRSNTFVAYKGKALSSASKYYWKVKIWNQTGEVSSWSDASFFVTGILSQDEWSNAKWVAYEEMPDSLRVVPGQGGSEREAKLGMKAKKRSIVPYFRKSFKAGKDIDQALVFVSGLGQYELNINGTKTGNYFLTPGWTQYTKQCFYNTYDVTDQLRKGENVVGAIVGNGFFYVNRERYRKTNIAFGYPMLRLKLIIRFKDDTLEQIVSGPDWKTMPSPVTYSSIYGGEDYDARLEQSGWNGPGFNDAQWKNVQVIKGPGGKMEAQKDPCLQVMNTFSPLKTTQPKPGIYVCDFGQNASGIVHFKVKGNKGDVVMITPAELLGEDSLANQTASGKPYYFSYTLKGEGVEEWEPKFTYYGFRYAQIEGAVPELQSKGQIKPVIQEIKFLHTRNSAPIVGCFECSNPLFNKIFDLINWAMKSNLASVTTDCPHREKLGWLEVTHLVGSSIKYNYDILNYYNKIIEDMINGQTSDGLVPDYVPEYNTSDGGFRDSPEWGSSSVLVPWYVYKWYGDKEALSKSYNMMQRYVAYLGSKAKDNILSYGLGDWFDLGPARPGPSQLTPMSLTATSIFYYDVDILSKVAEVLGKKEDAKKYSALALKLKTAFNKKFFNPETKVYGSGSQTSYSMPLYFGMVEPQYLKAVNENLAKSIKASGNALTTGDIGFRYLVRALEEGGASQLLYEMNNRDDVPGYGYQIKHGATALTESWPALKYVSNNHMMLGHLMEWFYSGLAGIKQQDDDTGFKKILIAPQFVNGIDWVKSSYNSINGNIEVSWKKEKGELLVDLTIPPNSSAFVVFPCHNPEQIKEGNSAVSKMMIVKSSYAGEKEVTISILSGKYKFRMPYSNN